MLTVATVIPEHERWIHEPKALRDLEAALARALRTTPDDSNVDEILKRLAETQ